jgi:hypothetical protein
LRPPRAQEEAVRAGTFVTSTLFAAICAATLSFTETACAPPDQPDEGVTQEQAALTGSINFDDSCGSDLRPALIKALKYGRIASNSPAFAACINNLRTGTLGFTAPYMPACSPSDPHANDPANQAPFVLQHARSVNPLTMKCTNQPDPARNAFADVHDENIKSEDFTWTGWLNGVVNQTNPDDPWWPTSQIASLIWHEPMHNYGYQHPKTCSKAGYDFQANTVPYIVQFCMQSTLSESGKASGKGSCGGVDSCGPDALPIITTPAAGSTTCQCVRDPRAGATLHFADVNGDKKQDAIVINPNGPIAGRRDLRQQRRHPRAALERQLLQRQRLLDEGPPSALSAGAR